MKGYKMSKQDERRWVIGVPIGNIFIDSEDNDYPIHTQSQAMEIMAGWSNEFCGGPMVALELADPSKGERVYTEAQIFEIIRAVEAEAFADGHNCGKIGEELNETPLTDEQCRRYLKPNGE